MVLQCQRNGVRNFLRVATSVAMEVPSEWSCHSPTTTGAKQGLSGIRTQRRRRASGRPNHYAGPPLKAAAAVESCLNSCSPQTLPAVASGRQPSLPLSSSRFRTRADVFPSSLVRSTAAALCTHHSPFRSAACGATFTWPAALVGCVLALSTVVACASCLLCGVEAFGLLGMMWACCARRRQQFAAGGARLRA